MSIIKNYHKDLHKETSEFLTELQQKFPNTIVTSGFRKNARTKQGNASRHSHGEAIDIAPTKEAYDYLWNTKDGIALLNKYGLGILDETNAETLKKTGGTGKHYHIGKDNTLVPLAQKRYKELWDEQEIPTSNQPQQYSYTPQNTTTVTNLPKTEKIVNSEEEQAKIAQATNQKEQDFLKEYQESFSQQEEVEQEEEPVYQLPQTNYVDMFNQVSQFIDSGVAQQGGEKDMYGNNVTAKIIDFDEDRSIYDGRTNTIKLGTDYRTWVKNDNGQEKLIAHESYHGKQLKEDRTNYDIAYNTDNKFWAQMQKRPEMMSTDNVWRNFHNRKDIESNQAVNNFAQQVPEAEFFRDAFGNIAFNKKVEQQQYFNPTTEEGEAYFYQNTGEEYHKLQQGGQQNYTQNELAFLSEIAIKDNQGQYNHPGKITQISSSNITMKNVRQALMGVSLETGEQRIMYPNKDYFFKNTKNVLEIPI